MNKRFIWNFEFETSHPLSQGIEGEKEHIRWESRFFWPETSIIKLQGLNERFLNISDYKIKQHSDTYILLADHHYNIKWRRGTLLYKPLLEQKDHIYGFDKKIDLDESAKEVQAENERIKLLRLVQKEGRRLDVEKETLTCKLRFEPGIKLELARLSIKNHIYFSVCLSGRCFPLIQSLSKRLLNEQKSCDYVSFLKQMMDL
ncbi:hypothetical protein E3983_13225 [Legionella israelensis]|uniref:Uncharacterized protein n=1 Tax=Legionella israelensis TaxID=454 RepID=A0AAX1EJH2_9GAMM|nr:hypothetical protein [Legionella israelensis]QBR85225.1 hypothetical protein E3983_13225 [Legionella israelensis]